MNATELLYAEHPVFAIVVRYLSELVSILFFSTIARTEVGLLPTYRPNCDEHRPR